MAGLPPQPAQHVDGASFAGAVTGGTPEPKSLFWHFPHYSNHGSQSPGGAIRTGPYKLLEYFENGTTQLFNLHDDPGEQVDLVDHEPETARALLTELHVFGSSSRSGRYHIAATPSTGFVDEAITNIASVSIARLWQHPFPRV